MKINPGVLLVGLAFFAAGIAMLVKQLRKRNNNTASVMAEVWGYHVEVRNRSDGRETVYYPVFRYYANGKWYENRGDVGRGRETYSRGEKLEIRYDPQNPDSFLIAGENTALILSVVAILLGVGVMVLSLFAK